MRYVFKGNQTHTLGVEIELQLVDAESGALCSAIDRFQEHVPSQWRDAFKPEFMQSYIEINTDVCATVADVERDLGEKLAWANQTAAQLGLCLLWSGTHPFSEWQEQQISAGERYAWLMETMQFIARRLVVFGLHVHVGVDSGDKAIQMCDRLLRHLPTLLALSSNSPFWCGGNTGLKSYRSKIMEALPTAGMPLTLRNWSEYSWLVNHLVATNFIQSIREIWWDVRPHAEFGTVEIRVMDMPLNMRHTLGLVALTQSLVAAISDLIDKGAYQFDSHPMIARQNKWHAARYGLDATLVDFDTMLAIPARQMAKRLVEHCRPYAERLTCLPQLEHINDILDQGTGAARQLRAFDESGGDARAVTRFLMSEQSSLASAPPTGSTAAT